MSWLLIPGVLLVTGAILWTVTWIWMRRESLGIYLAIVIFAFIISIVLCPVEYYSGINRAMAAEQYYIQVIKPSTIAEYDTYVVVSDRIGAIWQAGDYNLADYNYSLAKNRYWRSKLIIGSVVYPMPDFLKSARLSPAGK